MIDLGNNYHEIGLKVGLEIHQQLDTKHKLFCNCPTELTEQPNIEFNRMLRPTQSELGQVDQAALFEFKKGKTIEYDASIDTSCLVEMDEEPPHNLNEEAIDIALTTSILMNSKPVDEIHVMRKIVIDGSNTTGFQRTCVISLGGSIGKDKKISIQHVSVEEDAARKTAELKGKSNYRIDRLGIPLIEIATAPQIETPEEAETVALEIGKLLRATRKVRRGLGTIRQDLNISTKKGALIEVKGVQKLELISEIVDGEASRQISLLEIKKELENRNIKKDGIKENIHDVSNLFTQTGSKVISSSIEKGGVALAILLPGFGGLLGKQLQKGIRLGTEMAHRAMYWGGVGGIFHTDELPNYGISEQDVDLLREKVSASEKDAVVLVADSKRKAQDALKAVIERAKECLDGVPEETRAANEDGTSRYMRPRPGAARMYPETDVPPLIVAEEKLSKLHMTLPPMPEKLTVELMERHKINKKLSEQLVDSDYLKLFEVISKDTEIPASFIATILTEVIKSLSREGIQVENINDDKIIEVFQAVNSNLTAKEAVTDLLKWVAENPEGDVNKAIDQLGLKMISQSELRDRISSIIDKNKNLLEDPRSATGKLMKIIMADVRGKVEAKKVVQLINEEIDKRAK
ncbi:MAG: Glu-tRNA(Gln) amidotransferase subunit GatE [Candidatus Bathyarchaeia archaeon]|nr:Glu-tRNA(Gln) amidotransferase subunit GatE [Candidatus Bathyarchaeota archaeon]